MAETPDFGTFGRFRETPLGEMSPEMKDAYDFTMKLRGVVPGPHKNLVGKPHFIQDNRSNRILLPERIHTHQG